MNYRIRTVAELTGIPRNTLIAWERRYGFVRPQRHSNSYRSYDDSDVAKLKRVKAAIASGLSVSEAITLLTENAPGDDEVQAAEQTAVVAPERATTDRDPFAEIRSQLYAALTSYRGTESERLLAGLLGTPAQVKIHQVFFPILRQIGDAWERGQLSVAQEHYATAVLHEQMMSALLSLDRRNGNGPHAACTTFVGDTHEFGALAMAVRLSQSGHRVSHLGPNLSAIELAKFCKAAAPNLVCVSAILKQDHTSVVQYAEELRRLVSANTRLVIGGRGIDLSPMPEVSGVEFIANWTDFASATDAAALARV